MQKPIRNTFISRPKQAAVYSSLKKNDKLYSSELRYRRLFETAQDGILILDAYTGKIVDANPFLTNLLGYTRDELLDKELWQIGVFRDIVDSKKTFRDLQTNGYIRYKDLPLQTKDGESIDVEFISNIYMVGEEKVIQCNIRDITSRKQAEEAMALRTQELEDLTRSQADTKEAMMNVMEDLEEAKAVIEVEKIKDEAILASIGDGLIAVDSRRLIMIINKSAERMLGWKAKDLVGKKTLSLPLEDEAGEPVALNKRPTYIAMTTGKTINTNYFFVRKDLSRFQMGINVTPIKVGSKITGALVIFRDITREKEIDKAKSEFVSLASHQLRTPLGIVKWYLEALENENYVRQSPDRIRKYFAEIYKSNERVLSLVRDLLSVSRIDQGQVRNLPRPVDVIKVVADTVEQMQIVALKKKIGVHLILEGPHIPLVNIDAMRFHEAIENLIVNAIEYTGRGGAVEVSLKKSGPALIISVKDNGIGISKDDQKKLFTKFFRSEKALGYNAEGAGLGLYVVKSYVTGWGGRITAESGEGKGSTFTISLPINQKNNPPAGG